MPGRTDTTSNDGRKSFFIAYGDAIPALQGEDSDELLAPDQAATLIDNIIQLFPTADVADDVSAEPAICLEEAKRFLKALDSTANKFTFQTFDEPSPTLGRPRRYCAGRDRPDRNAAKLGDLH
jgi:hypothetical protein